ncbi:hypothetical protein KCP76_19970 [Salmonella enterica subsp. enterica serovar Weltevreden]|nr:hypothetical protein KCP76_19970 [Salmonella enterica subsp. enterica serovar Weltevreden]
MGFRLGLANSYSAESCQRAPADWLLIDGEHAPNNAQTVLTQLQAIAPGPSQPVVRPSWNDPVQIKQLLDVGAQTLLGYRWCRMPMKRNAPWRLAALSACRYSAAWQRWRGHRAGTAFREYSTPPTTPCAYWQIETREASLASILDAGWH